MRLLDRYLLRELLVPLGYCLCGFLVLWISADLFAELDNFQKKKLLAHDIVEYYLLSTPKDLMLLMPMALLLALLYSLTNHSRHNEITAIRAAGISLGRLCWPYLGVGLAASLFLLALNELWLPDSAEAAEQVLARRAPLVAGAPGRDWVQNRGFTSSRDGRKWQMALYNLKTTEMIKPHVLWTRPDGSRLWIDAERAVRTNGVWTFYEVREHLEAADTNSFLVPFVRTNVMAHPEFAETPEEIRSEIKLTATFNMRLAKRADIPVGELLNYLRLHPKPSRSDGYWLHTKLQGRLAAPWTCLVVVLIAIPFGAASGRRNVFVGVASSILICFIYFVLQQLGLALGTAGTMPAWLAAWFPNICFATVGLWMTARVR
jgi:lipopolysaccharide export system permease protein